MNLVLQLEFFMNKEVTSSLQAFQILRNYFNPFAEEVWVIALGSQLQVLGTEMIFRGTVDQCPIHPRDIFRFLIQTNASSFILAHNHPSLDVKPSERDLSLTRKIHTVSALMQIPIQDHVIFSDQKYFSMADGGFFKNNRKAKRVTQVHCY
jgi:DNA repair protein RadC